MTVPAAETLAILDVGDAAPAVVGPQVFKGSPERVLLKPLSRSAAGVVQMEARFMGIRLCTVSGKPDNGKVLWVNGDA